MSDPPSIDPEASAVLAAALERIDGIIDGSDRDWPDREIDPEDEGEEMPIEPSNAARLVCLTKELLLAAEGGDHIFDGETLPLPHRWLSDELSAHRQSNGQNYPCGGGDLEERICQLETEKDQLSLQVNVLSEQVEAQNEKIVELESSLSQSQDRLRHSEALLRQEASSRSAAESGRLDMMAQISALRLRLATAEHERQEMHDRSGQLESELILTCACLAEKEADLATFKSRVARNGAVTPVFETNSEMEKLKGALSTVMAANDEKERKIQEMKTTLNRYKKLQELVLSNPARRGYETSNGPNKIHLSDGGSFLFCSDMEDIPESPPDGRLADKPPPVPRQLQLQPTASSPLHEDFPRPGSRTGELQGLSPIRCESPASFAGYLRANSAENVGPPTPQKTPPAKRHYSTLPRPHAADILLQYRRQPSVDAPASTGHPPPLGAGQASHSFHNLHHPGLEVFRPPPRMSGKAPPAGSSFGKGFFRLRSGKRSSSAPELAQEGADPPREMLTMTTRRADSPAVAKDKKKGFRKIFGRVKRSGSENLGSADEAEFKRGGIRATAGPRLGWTRDVKVAPVAFKVKAPFREWDCTTVGDWLLSIGLGMYTVECKKWVKDGEQLLKASSHEFEKELGVKNPLHRKKLILAVSGSKEASPLEPEGRLDHHWVVRWLDDVGLPQYKDAFFEARVDGRVLHHLTVEDLFHLKVSNLLHHISIKRGIQVLRENDFDPHCLTRRSFPDDEKSSSKVSRWSNHRVMEWLRTVDLSEYAPNLRGSGVHGGLVVHEPLFNADLLAALLNIPSGKTLLRRHLSTQFKQLVGADVVQKKRECEAQAGHCPLSPSAKVKAIRRGHFSLMRRKNKNELSFEDYVCPMTFSEMFGSTASVKTKSDQQQIKTEEKFLMKENALKTDICLENMPASNV